MVKYIEPRVLGAESRLAAEAGYLVVYRLARENLVASVQAATVYMYIIIKNAKLTAHNLDIGYKMVVSLDANIMWPY